MYISLQDLLLISGIVSLLFVAGFLSWTLYEAARLLRNVNYIANIIRRGTEKAEDLVNLVGDKLTGLAGYSGMAAKAGEKVLGYIMDHMETDSAPTKKRAKRKMPSLTDLDEE